MNFKLIGTLGLICLTLSRVILAFGLDQWYAQQPVDIAHTLMLIGALSSIVFSYIFPEGIINRIATGLTIIGILAHIGMCWIDFSLYGLRADPAARDELIRNLTQSPAIWSIFMVIGPGFLYAGLATHAWRFIGSHPVSSLLTLIGSTLIGLGQWLENDQILVLMGYLVFTLGLTLLTYRETVSQRWVLSKLVKWGSFFALGFILFGVYNLYYRIQDQIEQQAHQAWVATLDHTASPNVQVLTDTITVDYLDKKRTLAIYLPAGYETDSIAYPVIYFLDGQSLFDQKVLEGQEWQIDEVLDSMGRIGQPQAIVVGIYNSNDRNKEYKPFPSTKIYSDKVVNGDQHAEWIANKVKPWIDAHYRTKKGRQSTIIGGASLGGLMAYYMLMEYPEVFGAGIVFSPSFWVNPIVYELHQGNDLLKQQKIYFNSGQYEPPTVNSIQKMKQLLLEAGMPESQIRLDVELGAYHSHMTWRKGFKKVYPWIVR